MASAEDILEQVARELGAHALDGGYFEPQRSMYRQDLEWLADRRDRRLLEVGAYPFVFSRCLALAGHDFVSVDLDPERAAGWLSAHGLTAIRCDVEREPLPLPDARFATVVLTNTFEHLRVDPGFALSEMARVLEPGGLLYLTTPNFYRLGNVVRFLLGRGLSNDPLAEYAKLRSVGHMGHVREYTARELENFLRQAGFEDVHIERRVIPSRHGRWVDRLHAALPRLRPELVVLARRR